MDGETILTWNITNWITVVLMVGVGFAVLAMAAQLYKKWGTGIPNSPISSSMPMMAGG